MQLGFFFCLFGSANRCESFEDASCNEFIPEPPPLQGFLPWGLDPAVLLLVHHQIIMN